MLNYAKLPDLTQYSDMGFGADDYSPSNIPADWRDYGLPHWGIYSDTMGILNGFGGLSAEVDVDLYDGRLGARTPMLELTPEDYRWLRVMKRPYPGMMALGDDGMVYAYDGFGGFFKKLFKKAKSVVKRVGSRIKKGVKKVLKKIPGGKYLLRLGSKVFEISKKIVKPLVKYVGKYAAKLAPVAAFIPGYGPAIAGALYAAGKVANLMNKYGAKLKGAAHAIRKLDFPNATAAKKFASEIKKSAAEERQYQLKHGKPDPKKLSSLIAQRHKRAAQRRRTTSARRIPAIRRARA